ncbi:MAG: LuxR family transcriptional regulator [Allosphingosinicella sp.]|uniref:LuxR family transcriptional regulator n=1 Tax=Allosphingosinicella sp. TaxID=2823234 RepID=UPI003924C52D
MELLQAAAQELGFDYVALLHHRSLERPAAGFIRLDTYPEGWEDELRSRSLIGHDPVHRASERTHVGFSWRELAELVPIGPRARELLDEARRFGIGEGFTVPANIPGEPGGSCSFAVKTGGKIPVGRLLCAEQVGAHAFRAARRLHGYARIIRSRPHLSRRERQCVRLVAAGKSDWEIARILGISIETVHQYVKRARSAYDVVSRAQLVACGLRDAVISFGEAVPER